MAVAEGQKPAELRCEHLLDRERAELAEDQEPGGSRVDRGLGRGAQCRDQHDVRALQRSLRDARDGTWTGIPPELTRYLARRAAVLGRGCQRTLMRRVIGAVGPLAATDDPGERPQRRRCREGVGSRPRQRDKVEAAAISDQDGSEHREPL